MASDAAVPHKRRKNDPADPQLDSAAEPQLDSAAEPQLDSAAHAQAQERGIVLEPEADQADERYALAQGDLRALEAALCRARAACAEKDSEILYLQNMVVALQPLVPPSLMLVAAFPPPLGGNDSDDDTIEGPGMRLLRLAVLPPPLDLNRNDADALFDEGMRLVAAGRYRNAVSKLKRAVALGHVAAHAELAWLLIVGKGETQICRNCVPDCVADLAKRGSALGCAHSRGIYALKSVYNYAGGNFRGHRALVRGLRLARESAAAGSKYGQYVLGKLHLDAECGLQQDVAEALVYFRLASEQGLELAHYELGKLYWYGHGVAQDHAAAVGWYRRAAQQGYLMACMDLSRCYTHGDGVDADRFQAIYWYKRAYVAGLESSSQPHLNELGVNPEELLAIKVRYNPQFHCGCGYRSQLA